MPDWTASMQQTYEYYEVDPDTWEDRRKIDIVTSSSITRDVSSDTGGSASFNVSSDLGELYIRVYLITTQNRITEKFPLGTYLCQTTGEGFDGKVKDVTLDAYAPLLELKEKNTPLGYSLGKDVNILQSASRIVSQNVRAPVVGAEGDYVLSYPFVANINDTWFTFISDLLASVQYTMDVDELGRIIFIPEQDTNSLQPIWTYTDDNSSILQPDFDVSRDLYGIPNVLEVVYTKEDGIYTKEDGSYIYSKVTNDDPNSPISTVTRGREVMQRITDPDIFGSPTQVQLDDYAKQTLRNLSTIEYTLTYTHGYCPVRVGDCVLINYERAGLINQRAKVIRQNIKCETGCQVEETAVYTLSLWR